MCPVPFHPFTGLTKYCNGLIRVEYSKRGNYAVLPVPGGLTRYWVRKAVFGAPPCADPTSPLYWPFVVPEYMRTRQVRLVEGERSSYWQCDCCCFEDMSHCCRHIYAVIGRRPLAADAGLRWFTSYLLNYGTKDEGVYKRMKLTNVQPGPRQCKYHLVHSSFHHR